VTRSLRQVSYLGEGGSRLYRWAVISLAFAVGRAHSLNVKLLLQYL